MWENCTCHRISEYNIEVIVPGMDREGFLEDIRLWVRPEREWRKVRLKVWEDGSIEEAGQTVEECMLRHCGWMGNVC